MSIALTVAGGSISPTMDPRAPVTNRVADLHVAHMAGIGSVALGGLGVPLAVILNRPLQPGLAISSLIRAAS
jgi:hypothetical protein